MSHAVERPLDILPIARNYNRRQVSLVGKVPDYHEWGRLGFDSRGTNTQGLKIIEEKVLPLL